MSDQLALDTGDERLAPWVGVNTVLGYTLWPGDHMLRWAWKLGHRNILLTDGRAHERRAAGNDLHRLHEQLHAGTRQHVQSLPVDVRGFAESLYAWHHHHAPVMLAVELSLRNPEHRIRGRIDGIRECDETGCACGGRGISVYDLKTGGNPGDPVDAKSHRQVGGGYRLLWAAGEGEGIPDELRGRPMCGGEIIRIHQDGTPGEVTEALPSVDGFLASLASYRDLEAQGILPERRL